MCEATSGVLNSASQTSTWVTGTPVSKPTKQPPRPVVPAGKEQPPAASQQNTGTAPFLFPTAVPGVTALYAGLQVGTPAPGQPPGTPSSSSPLGAGAGKGCHLLTRLSLNVPRPQCQKCCLTSPCRWQMLDVLLHACQVALLLCCCR
jgi:hypothetical protein